MMSRSFKRKNRTSSKMDGSDNFETIQRKMIMKEMKKKAMSVMRNNENCD
jgi:hypothetical protein